MINSPGELLAYFASTATINCCFTVDIQFKFYRRLPLNQGLMLIKLTESDERARKRKLELDQSEDEPVILPLVGIEPNPGPDDDLDEPPLPA
jgi:hypothetical protein